MPRKPAAIAGTLSRRRNKPNNKLGSSRFFSGMGVGFSPDQIEFMKALDKFKRDAGRPFPTCSEVLDVLLALGYRKDEPAKKK